MVALLWCLVATLSYQIRSTLTPFVRKIEYVIATRNKGLKLKAQGPSPIENFATFSFEYRGLFLIVSREEPQIRRCRKLLLEVIDCGENNKNYKDDIEKPHDFHLLNLPKWGLTSKVFIIHFTSNVKWIGFTFFPLCTRIYLSKIRREENPRLLKFDFLKIFL